ncbi:MAG TPA: TRAP transporter small permease subunit [Burkholderiaceae bacterium]|nr:TRAP transporter small permease subunit [Burkholderiaceae bacterium]
MSSSPSKITRYLAIQDKISDRLGQAVSWISLILIAVLLFEVFMRYLLNTPTSWGHELSAMLFGAFGIFSGAYTLRHGGHVRIEIIYMLFPDKAKQLCDVIVYTASTIVFVVFLKMGIDFAYKSWLGGEISSKSSWEPLLWPIKATIPIALAFLILQNIAELLRSLFKLVGVNFEDPRELESPEQQ